MGAGGLFWAEDAKTLLHWQATRQRTIDDPGF